MTAATSPSPLLSAAEEPAIGARLPLLLTIPEVADILRTSPKAVYCMASEGKLPGLVKVGRRTLVRRGELLRSLGIGRGSSGDNR